LRNAAFAFLVSGNPIACVTAATAATSKAAAAATTNGAIAVLLSN